MCRPGFLPRILPASASTSPSSLRVQACLSSPSRPAATAASNPPPVLSTSLAEPSPLSVLSMRSHPSSLPRPPLAPCSSVPLDRRSHPPYLYTTHPSTTTRPASPRAHTLSSLPPGRTDAPCFQAPDGLSRSSETPQSVYLPDVPSIIVADAPRAS